MSVREDEQRKNSCPSRGLGLAAAAIGVGVGAALYYFFSKRPENPDGEGSTSSTWQCEQPQVLNDSDGSDYTTFSECTTSDTSMLDDAELMDQCFDDSVFNGCPRCGYSNIRHEMYCEHFLSSSNNTFDSSQSESESYYEDSNDSDESEESAHSRQSASSRSSVSAMQTSDPILTSSFDTPDFGAGPWNVTVPAIDVPTHTNLPSSPFSRMFTSISSFISPNRSRMPSEEEQMTMLRAQAFRERSWSLEECSICFEVMLRDQELLTLPCTHNFHVACIGPWLQEQQTCPNCRKSAE